MLLLVNMNIVISGMILFLCGHDLLVKHASVQGWYALRIASIGNIVALHVLIDKVCHDLIYEEVLALILRLLGHLSLCLSLKVLTRWNFHIEGHLLDILQRGPIQTITLSDPGSKRLLNQIRLPRLILHAPFALPDLILQLFKHSRK